VPAKKTTTTKAAPAAKRRSGARSVSQAFPTESLAAELRNAGVRPGAAQAIVARFQSREVLASASMKQLTELKGVGASQAQRVRELLAGSDAGLDASADPVTELLTSDGRAETAWVSVKIDSRADALLDELVRAAGRAKRDDGRVRRLTKQEVLSTMVVEWGRVHTQWCAEHGIRWEP
jgi:hypothetical protein